MQVTIQHGDSLRKDADELIARDARVEVVMGRDIFGTRDGPGPALSSFLGIPAGARPPEHPARYIARPQTVSSESDQ